MIRNGTTEVKNKVVASDGIYYNNDRPVYKKAHAIKTTYKMDVSEYNARIANGCEICGDKPERSLHIDHDHKCCKGAKTCGACVRGIVCNGCNKAIDKYERGHMRLDYPKRDKIIEYIEKYA